MATEYRPRSPLCKEMYRSGGERERYAMTHGNPTRVEEGGRKLIRFTYSKYNEYQDANGATYDIKEKRWVN